MKSLKININHLDRKDIFLIGFYIVCLFILSLAAIIDFIIENYIDAYTELLFISLTLISIAYYKYSNNYTVALYNLVLIATLITYVLFINNNFNISIFHAAIPLIYFSLFTLKRSLIYTFIHESIVICIYIYGYIKYPNHPILHNMSLLTGIFMGSLIIIIFGIVYHISVEKSYQMLKQSDKQKELLLQEVHHRVKNNLNIISSILGLQLLRETDETIKEVFEKNRLRIDSIAMVHEILYIQKDFEKINIYEYLYQLASTVVGISEEEITINIKKDVLYLHFETVLEVGIITTELIINSIKHAFTDSKRSINIDIQITDNEYIYKYQDSNEDVIDVAKMKTNKSLGLKLIYMMVEQMNAQMFTENKSGLQYTIRIPQNGT